MRRWAAQLSGCVLFAGEFGGISQIKTVIQLRNYLKYNYCLKNSLDMVDLTVALAIAKIAYTKFFESSIGKLGEKFTETGLQKIDELYTMIRQKLRGNTAANNALAEVEQGKPEALQEVAVYLLNEMRADPNFATDVQKIADEINIHRVEDNSSQTQNIHSGGKGYQTKIGDNSTNHLGDNITYNYNGTPPQP